MFEETLVYKKLSGYPTKDNRFLISDSLEEIIDYFEGRNFAGIQFGGW